MRTIVTGGAGFIGSNLVDRLVAAGHEVVVLDDLSTGRLENLRDSPAEFVDLDLTDEEIRLEPVLDGAETVFHLAANADVRNGINNPRRDIDSGILVTHRLCEAARQTHVNKIVFSSTGAVYGDVVQHPTKENAPFPIQTSLYGMSKVAAEGILSTYASHEFFQVVMHRFVSVLGPRYLHGHVIDFVRQLYFNPNELHVLGDGTQRKSYLSVYDCVSGLMTLGDDEAISIYNLGSEDYCSVRDSAAWVCAELALEPMVFFGKEDRGWIGDNPFTWLDVSRALGEGWRPTVSIESAIKQTARWLYENPDVLRREDRRTEGS